MSSLLGRAASAVSKVLPFGAAAAPKEPWELMANGEQPHALELAWRLHGRSLIDDCRRSLAELEKYITRHGSVMGDLAGRQPDAQNVFRTVRRIIRFRFHTLQRIAWLEERAKGKELPPPALTEPTAEELIREYVNTVGFKSIDKIMDGGARVIRQCQERLKEAKVELKSALGTYGNVVRAQRDWSILDAQVADLIKDIPATEARLEASMDAHGRLTRVLGRIFKETVEAIGIEKVARAFVDAKLADMAGLPAVDPAEEDRRALEDATVRIREYVQSLGLGKEASEAAEARMIAAEQKTIADHRARVRSGGGPDMGEETARAIGTVQELLARGLDGYMELGALAAKYPNKFPRGFVNGLIDVSTKAFIDTDVETCATWLDEI